MIYAGLLEAFEKLKDEADESSKAGDDESDDDDASDDRYEVEMQIQLFETVSLRGSSATSKRAAFERFLSAATKWARSHFRLLTRGVARRLKDARALALNPRLRPALAAR